jgi:hypothetical protein
MLAGLLHRTWIGPAPALELVIQCIDVQEAGPVARRPLIFHIPVSRRRVFVPRDSDVVG